jgi:hypothetical protein
MGYDLNSFVVAKAKALGVEGHCLCDGAEINALRD